MQTIFFFYGLAFLVMGIVILVMPKKRDLLGLSEDLWLVGLFGLLHGANEWVDLFILRGSPFNVPALTVLGALLLPISFVPLLQFGVRTLFRGTRSFRVLKYLWMIALMGWAAACFLTQSFLIPGIVARYFICIPGTLLTAAGLLRALGKANAEDLPRSVSAAAIGGAIFFILYGVLSGLVVPKAGFFPASLINYPNFIQMTGIPVQFFRMVLAILLGTSFFALTGIYTLGQGNHKIIRRGGIRRKITLWLSVMVFLVFVFFSILGFRLVLQMRTQTIGEGLQGDATLIAVSISRLISKEMEELRSYFNDSEWKEFLTEANASQGLLSPTEREDSFKEMDRKWADPSATDLEKYLSGPMTFRLKNYADTEERLAEVFLTDRYGGLVAASGKTTDFFQADEPWWRDTFNGGKGRETVQDVAWDGSSKTLSVDFAIPVKNAEGGVIGIAKQALKIQALFKYLKDYRVGKTGHAVLIDAAGDILFHQEIEPLTTKFYGEKGLGPLLQSDKKWAILFEPHSHKEEMFVAFAKVESPVLEANGIRWYVFVDQSKAEILAPLWKIWLILGGVGGVFLLICLGIVSILASRLAEPLQQLSHAVEEIRQGNWDYRVEIHSADEIQTLAESFRFMVEHLRERQSELLRSKGEIEGLSHGLEKKVEARTKELSESQRAMLNILEDLNETNEKMKKFTEELEIQSWGLQKANDGIQVLCHELEKKNAELAKLDKLKDDFVSIVAHELRNPLGVVREAASLILDGLAGPVSADQKKYIEVIKRTGERLIHITSDLLDLAKIESGKIVVNYETMDLLSVARQACEGIALRANKKGLVITQDFPDGKLEISGDFDKLSQVMINLLSNAYKFTEIGGITVEVRDLGEEVRCAVKDTGPGISKENLSRLFSKFEQFGKPTTHSEKGSGLGLVISKSILEAHGGKIWAESEPGKGSSFIFTLPKQHAKKKLGEILVEEKTLTSEQLAAALLKQSGKKA
jgi:signal transduction histidine kinase